MKRIRNGIRNIRSMVKDGHMTPPAAVTRERSLQGQTLKMIEGEDPALPIGSTSKTYDPQKDYTMWQRKDSSQYWKQAASSGDQWRPRLWSDTEMSSVAGDTSDVSATAHGLKSIREQDGDTVKGSRGGTGQ